MEFVNFRIYGSFEIDIFKIKKWGQNKNMFIELLLPELLLREFGCMEEIVDSFPVVWCSSMNLLLVPNVSSLHSLIWKFTHAL